MPTLINPSQSEALHLHELSKLFKFQLPSTINIFNSSVSRKLSMKEIIEKQRLTKFFCLQPTNIDLFNIEEFKEMDFTKVNVAMGKFLEKIMQEKVHSAKDMDLKLYNFNLKVDKNSVDKFKDKLLKLRDGLQNVGQLKKQVAYDIDQFKTKYNCRSKDCDGTVELERILDSVRKNTQSLNVNLCSLSSQIDHFFDLNEEIVPKMQHHVFIAETVSKITAELNFEIQKVLDLNSKIKKSDDHFKIAKTLMKHIESINPILLGANKQGAFFTTSSIRKLAEQKNYLVEIQKVFEWYEMGKLFNFIKKYFSELHKIRNTINILDMHQAYARSNFRNAVFIENKGILCETCARFNLDLNTENVEKMSFFGFEHPLITDCVKNDFIFERKFVKLTGPNTSGKSTILRSLSLIIYLTQIGAPSCVEKAYLNYFECIRIRIGSSDKEGESTFMVEMSELSEIIKIIESVKGNLLILIDELGRGTSINDGLAISKGVMEYLKKLDNVFCVFVTHFHELKHEDNENQKIEDDNWSLKNFKLVKESNLSFGIECAKDSGFPASVIEAAYKYYNCEE